MTRKKNTKQFADSYSVLALIYLWRHSFTSHNSSYHNKQKEWRKNNNSTLYATRLKTLPPSSFHTQNAPLNFLHYLHIQVGRLCPLQPLLSHSPG